MRTFLSKLNFIIILSMFSLAQSYTVTQVWAMENDRFKEAQAIVEKIVAQYPEIVRLTIHAVPTSEKNSRIIACNIKEKIGKPSDSEDLEAMKNNKTVILKEGDKLDVTAPVCDVAGKPIAATGITLRLKKGESEDAVVKKAKAIAGELTKAIQQAGKSLW